MKSPVLSPRRQRAREREKMMTRAVKVVTSPLPYAIIVIFFIMIVMIFIDIMPISGLICTISILMVLTIVFGNYWQNSIIWQEIRTNTHHQHAQQAVESEQRLVQLSPKALSSHSRRGSRARADSRHSRSSSLGSDFNVSIQKPEPPTAANTQDSPNKTTNAAVLSLELGAVQSHHDEHDDHHSLPYYKEDHLDNLNDFFDELFKSIDYSLLLIFLGTFIVIESMAMTGLPRIIW